MKTCELLICVDASPLTYAECAEPADWIHIGDKWHEATGHVCCDACFGKLDHDAQFEYEPLLERDYSGYTIDEVNTHG